MLMAPAHQAVITAPDPSYPASNKAQRGLMPAAELDPHIEFHPTLGSPRDAQVTHAAATAGLSPEVSPSQGDTAGNKHRQEWDLSL